MFFTTKKTKAEKATKRTKPTKPKRNISSVMIRIFNLSKSSVINNSKRALNIVNSFKNNSYISINTKNHKDNHNRMQRSKIFFKKKTEFKINK